MARPAASGISTPILTDAELADGTRFANVERYVLHSYQTQRDYCTEPCEAAQHMQRVIRGKPRIALTLDCVATCTLVASSGSNYAAMGSKRQPHVLMQYILGCRVAQSVGSCFVFRRT
jgi:hypothetical protein